jgi:hypothetical protein
VEIAGLAEFSEPVEGETGRRGRSGRPNSRRQSGFELVWALPENRLNPPGKRQRLQQRDRRTTAHVLIIRECRPGQPQPM